MIDSYYFDVENIIVILLDYICQYSLRMPQLDSSRFLPVQVAKATASTGYSNLILSSIISVFRCHLVNSI